MADTSIIYRAHALQRMFERKISADDVRQIVAVGETIEDYPDDFPYPSRLILGWSGSRPIHIVIAFNAMASETIIVTVYEPDPKQWSADMRNRSTT